MWRNCAILFLARLLAVVERASNAPRSAKGQCELSKRLCAQGRVREGHQRQEQLHAILFWQLRFVFVWALALLGRALERVGCRWRLRSLTQLGGALWAMLRLCCTSGVVLLRSCLHVCFHRPPEFCQSCPCAPRLASSIDCLPCPRPGAGLNCLQRELFILAAARGWGKQIKRNRLLSGRP